MTYTIHDTSEETYCDHCGRPLLSGDRAHMSADEKLVGCSQQCLGAAKQTMSERPLVDERPPGVSDANFDQFYA
jgi:hypothetical protein